MQKLKDEFQEKTCENTQQQTYNLNEILKKFDLQREKPMTKQELKREINSLKIEVETLKKKKKTGRKFPDYPTFGKSKPFG